MFHDRYFIDRIVDHVLAFEGEGKIKDFVGNFSEYREMKELEAKNPVPVAKVIEKEKPAPQTTTKQETETKKKLTFNEQRELQTIEKEMPKLEKKRAEILEKLNNEKDYDKISVLSKELEDLSTELENFEMRWLELQE